MVRFKLAGISNQDAIEYLKQEIEYKCRVTSPLLEGVKPDCVKVYEAAITALEYQREIYTILTRIYEEIGKRMFSAECYNKDFDGREITNLLCYGDVADIIDKYLGYDSIPSPWHKVAEGDLPNHTNRVLVYIKYKASNRIPPYCVANYAGGKWWYPSDREIIGEARVIAWMELPEYMEE